MDSNLMKDLKDILTLLTPVAIAWIAYLQIKISAKQKEIGVKVDGMTSKLVEAEKGKSDAEGQLKGRADAKAEIVIPANIEVALKTDTVEKVAETTVETIKTDPAIDVKKVEGAKPVKLKK